jgi:hypothetical protein
MTDHMKNKTVPAAAAMGLLGVLLLGADSKDARPSHDSPEFATHVMTKIDDQYRGDKSHGVLEMQVKTRHWTRKLSMESWSLGKSYSLVRILEPKKEKGTATLKAKDNLFTYLSKTGRTIKIASGMMGGSWMGSHFTNDDLMRHTRLSEDFSVKLGFEGADGGQDVYRFVLTPKPGAPVVWGKIEIAVRQSDLQPTEQMFFDEEGAKVRSIEFSEYQKVSGRVIPTRMTVKPLDGSGEYTTVSWKKIDFDAKLTESFFSIQKLKSL